MIALRCTEKHETSQIFKGRVSPFPPSVGNPPQRATPEPHLFSRPHGNWPQPRLMIQKPKCNTTSTGILLCKNTLILAMLL